MNKKLGKNADDIFSPKPKKQSEHPVEKQTEVVLKEKEGRGRPIEHKEGWSKVTVVLLDKQIHWLDQLASTIRLNTKAAVSRAEIIRALISAMNESEINFTQLRSEEELKDRILTSMKCK